MSVSAWATQHAYIYPTHTADLKALYAEETEVLVHLFVSECLLGLVEVVLQVFLYLLSTTKKERRRLAWYTVGTPGPVISFLFLEPSWIQPWSLKKLMMVTEPDSWPLTCAPGATSEGKTGWLALHHSWPRGRGWILVFSLRFPAALWILCLWGSEWEVAQGLSGYQSRVWRPAPWRTPDNCPEWKWASRFVTCKSKCCNHCRVR